MQSKAFRLVGELFILAAVLIGLWLVYENAFTNLNAKAQETAAAKTLRYEWAANKVVTPVTDQPFALLYIPRLKASVWGLPVVEGVGQADLAKGVGHYPQSQLPGETGNFAIAGHRVTHGQPFYDFPKLRQGDPVFVKTASAWYEYRLFSTKFVSPADYYVVTRVPRVELPKDAQGFNLLTLTTCDPAWNSYRRWIWWGTLTGIYPASTDPTVGGT